MDIEKPLVTSVIIRGLEQSVMYEGVQKLCFSCGWIVHRKEACSYSIREANHMERMDNDTPNVQKRTTCVEHDLMGPSVEDKNDTSERPPVQH